MLFPSVGGSSLICLFCLLLSRRVFVFASTLEQDFVQMAYWFAFKILDNLQM